MKVGTYLTLYTTTNSKRIEDLNIRAKTVKLLGENIGGNLHDFVFCDGFLAQATKGKNR